MPTQYDMRAARVLQVYCPIQPHTLTAMQAADGSAIGRDPHLAKMVSIIRSSDALGDFGLYKSVIEITPGWELFTPGAEATPALGESGSPSTSPTAILTVYIAEEAPSDAVDQGIAAILASHPWEVPVIELSETTLLTRGSGRTAPL